MAVPVHMGEERKQKRVGRSGRQIAHRIALLQQAGEEAPALLGQRLKGQSGAHAPFATHRYPKQRTEPVKTVQRCREGARQFEKGITGDVQHQCRTPPIFVGEHSKEESTDGPEGESQKESFSNCGWLGLKVTGDRRNTEDQEEEVESVERPAEKACRECMALLRGQAPKGGRHSQRRSYEIIRACFDLKRQPEERFSFPLNHLLFRDVRSPWPSCGSDDEGSRGPVPAGPTRRVCHRSCGDSS